MKQKGTAQRRLHPCRGWQWAVQHRQTALTCTHPASAELPWQPALWGSQLFSQANKSIHHPYCQAEACSHANLLLHLKVKIRTWQQQQPQVPGGSCPGAAPFPSPAARAQQLGMHLPGQLLHGSLTPLCTTGSLRASPRALSHLAPDGSSRK